MKSGGTLLFSCLLYLSLYCAIIPSFVVPPPLFFGLGVKIIRNATQKAYTCFSLSDLVAVVVSSVLITDDSGNYLMFLRLLKIQLDVISPFFDLYLPSGAGRMTILLMDFFVCYFVLLLLTECSYHFLDCKLFEE